MSTAVLTPLVVAGMSALVAWPVARRLRPEAATWFVSAMLVVSTMSVLWVLMIVGFAGVPVLHTAGTFLAWCGNSLGDHSRLPSPLGLGALATLVAAASAARRTRRVQCATVAPPGVGGVSVLDSDEPTAFALPGSPGQVIITTAMLDLLNDEERVVVVTHEQAHLDLGHHHFVRVAEMAGAALPPFRPLVRRVRLATERWADEVTAARLDDRRLVAGAITRAALGAQPVIGVLGMSDTGVVERVDALLEAPPQRRPTVEGLAAGVVAIAVISVLGSAVQAHHWLARLIETCLV